MPFDEIQKEFKEGLSICEIDIPKTDEKVEAEINELFPINLEGPLDDERNKKKDRKCILSV